MKLLVTLLAVVFILALPGLAAAAAEEEFSKEDRNNLAGLMLVPALLLLLALPAALAFRAFAKFPDRIADTLSERPVVSVVLGVGNVVLLILLATAGKASPAIAVVAGILWVIFTVVALVGLTGAATNLARRFRTDARHGTFALAWLTISGVSLLPILGVLFLLWLVSGAIGGTLLAVYAGRPVTPPAAPSTPEG
ncbi:MAG: hypothetical protein ABFS86_06780 [Planctomycetota bacterium]